MPPDASTRVFIVEDQSIVTLELSGRLRDLGHVVVGVAVRGEEAIERILATSPDILLIDIHLPGDVDGVSVVEAVRPQLDVGVVYLTAYADAPTIRRVRPTEPEAYLIKPIDERLLEVTVQMVAYRVHAERVRRHSAMRLKERESQLAEAQQIAKIGSFEIDFETNVSQWSDEMCRILGFEPSRCSGGVDAFLGAIHEADRLDASRMLTAEHQTPLQVRIRRAGTNEIRFVEVRTRLRRERDGKTVALVGSVQDVTERRRMEERLVHISKMEAIGTLASGVAHDFNNRLMAIIGFAGLLEGSVSEEEHQDWANRIRELCSSASEVAKKLLALARTDGEVGPRADLGRVICDARVLLETMLDDNVEVEVSVPPEAVYVDATSAELQEVLMALAANAAYAMPHGGRLAIVVREFRSAGADWVQWEISDDGVGMDDVTRARACDAFFTTKPPGEGTGLGLAVVRGFVLARGGDLEVESQRNLGTKVSLLLPRTEAAEARPISSAVLGGMIRQPSGAHERR